MIRPAQLPSLDMETSRPVTTKLAEYQLESAQTQSSLYLPARGIWATIYQTIPHIEAPLHAQRYLLAHAQDLAKQNRINI